MDLNQDIIIDYIIININFFREIIPITEKYLSKEDKKNAIEYLPILRL
jgi:hypothetical protein